MDMDNVLTMLYVEGEESRLSPLCKDRSISAMPFAGRYLIIDFVLSNFLNSGFYKIKVLTQYRCDALLEHLSTNWNLSYILGHHVEHVSPQMKTGCGFYNGSADAIYQNLNFLQKQKYDSVCVFRSDTIYKMDVRKMYGYHAGLGSDLTIAVVPVPMDYAERFEIVEVDERQRVIGYEDRPENPKPIPGIPDMAFASMGNYIFNSRALIKSLNNNKSDTEWKLSKHVLPGIINRCKIYAYDFGTNSLPGMTEEERGLWINIDNLDTYWKANMDLTSVSPLLNLYDCEWPVRGFCTALPPAKFVFANEDQARVGAATDSIISEGCIISGGRVNRCVLFPKVRVNSFSQVSDSILMEGAEIGRHARIRNTIIEDYVKIPQGMKIGYDLKEDMERFHVSSRGIVAVTKEAIVEAAKRESKLLYDYYFGKNRLNRISNFPSQTYDYYYYYYHHHHHHHHHHHDLENIIELENAF